MYSSKLYEHQANHLPLLDNKYRILDTIGEGRYAK